MSAEPRTFRTKAEEALAAEFKAAALPGGAEAVARRAAAFALFERAGLPHRRIEEWKYTDLRALMRTAAPLAPESRHSAAIPDLLEGLGRARVAIVNGRFDAARSDLSGLDGITVEPLAEVLSRDPDSVGRLFQDADDAMLALNSAFMQGGAVITVADGAAPLRPIEIAHVTEAGAPVAVYSRSIVTLGAGASLRLIESHSGPASVAYQVNTVAEVEIGDGAKLTWARLQTEGYASQHIASFAAKLGADAQLDHLAVNAGAALWRWQGFVTLAGKGGRVGFNGATMLAAREHGDTALIVTHVEPHGKSRELFKTAIDGEAEGAFQGRIVVKQIAQKTDARMMTKALLLSDTGEFASKPELEIFADDVQCGHGATTGRIDDAQLFYLMARGVPRAVAERLLIEAFLDDAIDGLGDEAIGAALKGTITAWLARRGGA